MPGPLESRPRPLQPVHVEIPLREDLHWQDGDTIFVPGVGPQFYMGGRWYAVTYSSREAAINGTASVLDEVVDHNDLANRGALTHAQIEALLAELEDTRWVPAFMLMGA